MDIRETAARSYVERGWPIFVLSQGKVPVRKCDDCAKAGPEHKAAECACLMCHGFYAGTNDWGRVERMLDLHPNGPLALRTGPASGILVLDFEGPDKSALYAGAPVVNGMDTLDQWESYAGFSLDPTLTATTPSGGVHLFYQMPEGLTWRSGNKRLPGMDIKCEYGYVGIPCGGLDRTWMVGEGSVSEPTLMSDDLVEFVHRIYGRERARGAGTRQEPGIPSERVGGLAEQIPGYDYEEFVRDGCPDGFRDHFCNDMAFRLRQRGADLEHALAELRRHWERFPQPPIARYHMPWADAAKKIERVWATVAEPAPLPVWPRPEIGRIDGLDNVVGVGARGAAGAAGSGGAVHGRVGHPLGEVGGVETAEEPLVEGAGDPGAGLGLDVSPEPVDGQSGEDPPDIIAGYVRVLEADGDQPELPTDTGNASRLVRLCGHDMRYVMEWDRWLIWNGQRWVIDKMGAALRSTKQVARDIRAQAIATQDQDGAKVLARWALASESLHSRKAMLTLAGVEEEIALSLTALNADPMILVVRNGVLDLRTGRLRDARREDYSTYMANVEYDPHARCPRWLEHVDFVANTDPHVAAYLQRAVGYSLTGMTRDQAFFSLEGTGANGKNAFVEPIMMMMGDYAQTSTSALLTGGDEQHPTIMADLVGARMVFIDEARRSASVNVERIKTITGSKHVKARRMGKDFFEFPAQLKLWIAGNAQLKLDDPSDGIWRRLHRVKFDAKVPAGRRVTDYGQLLYDEEAAGILNWALEGLRSYLEMGGLSHPDSVKEAVEELRDDEDTMGQWLAECWETTGHDGDRVTVGDLYQSYRIWAMASGVPLAKVPERRYFGRQLSGRGLTQFRARVNGVLVRGYSGLRAASS